MTAHCISYKASELLGGLLSFSLPPLLVLAQNDFFVGAGQPMKQVTVHAPLCVQFLQLLNYVVYDLFPLSLCHPLHLQHLVYLFRQLPLHPNFIVGSFLPLISLFASVLEGFDLLVEESGDVIEFVFLEQFVHDLLFLLEEEFGFLEGMILLEVGEVPLVEGGVMGLAEGVVLNLVVLANFNYY